MSEAPYQSLAQERQEAIRPDFKQRTMFELRREAARLGIPNYKTLSRYELRCILEEAWPA